MLKDEKEHLSDKELEFYSRQILLSDIGYSGQLKLKEARVCVAGLGGLGSPAALLLAAIGVGFLRLVDYDVVERSNLQRQHLYGEKFLGYPKVEIAAKRLLELNPNTKIDPLPLSIEANNVVDIIRDMDLVVDGLDSMTPRYAINRACVKLGIPYIFGAAITTLGNVSTIIPRKTACLECFQGNLEDDMLPKCSVVGIYPTILGIIASVEVTEATRIILGKEPYLANKIFYCDVGDLTFEKVHIAKAENCPVCSSNPLNPPKPLMQDFVREICARKGKRVFVVTPKTNLQLNIDELQEHLVSESFEIQVKANLGVTFINEVKETISILKSGIMIIEGANKEEARSLYSKIMVNGLNIHHSKLE